MTVAEMLEALARDWLLTLQGGFTPYWVLSVWQEGRGRAHEYRGKDLGLVVARAYGGGQDGWVE